MQEKQAREELINFLEISNDAVLYHKRNTKKTYKQLLKEQKARHELIENIKDKLCFVSPPSFKKAYDEPHAIVKAGEYVKRLYRERIHKFVSDQAHKRNLKVWELVKDKYYET